MNEANELPQTLPCPNNCDGVMELTSEHCESFCDGKLDMSYTLYAYECPKCHDRFTTTESDELMIKSIVRYDS